MSIEVRDIPSRDEWLRWRRETIGASEIACVLGLSPFATPFQLWCRKRGEAADMADNALLRRGRLMEPAMLAWLRDEHGVDAFAPGRWYHHTELRMSATPDAMFACDDEYGVVEFKVVTKPKFEADWLSDGEVIAPLYYRLQALQTAKLTGAVLAYIGVWVMDTWEQQEHLIPVPLDAAADESWDICKRAASAWWDRADKGLAPEPDYRLDGEAIRQMYRGGGPVVDLSGNNRVPELLAEREAERQWISGFRADAKPHETRLAEIENELKALLGDAECATLPGFEITWKSYEVKARAATTGRRFNVKRVNGDAR